MSKQETSVDHGICPRVRTLVMRKSWWGGVLGRLWMVFLGGVGGGIGNVRSRWAGSVFTGRNALLNSPIFSCYISYIEQWGFLCTLPHTEDSEETAAPGSTTDSTEQWVWCLMYMRSCYFCYMFSLGSSSGNTGSVRIYRSSCKRYTPNI